MGSQLRRHRVVHNHLKWSPAELVGRTALQRASYGSVQLALVELVSPLGSAPYPAVLTIRPPSGTQPARACPGRCGEHGDATVLPWPRSKRDRGRCPPAPPAPGERAGQYAGGGDTPPPAPPPSRVRPPPPQVPARRPARRRRPGGPGSRARSRPAAHSGPRGRPPRCAAPTSGDRCGPREPLAALGRGVAGGRSPNSASTRMGPVRRAERGVSLPAPGKSPA